MNLLPDVISNCFQKLESDRERESNGLYSELSIWVSMLTYLAPQDVAIHFSRIGNDPGAARMLAVLDDHPVVGDHIYCLPGMLTVD